MALNYKIITRKVSDLKGGAKTDKAFATPVYTGYTELEDICKAISERSALSSADVKGVLDSLNYVLDLELRGGRIVRMGELATSVCRSHPRPLILRRSSTPRAISRGLASCFIPARPFKARRRTSVSPT